MIFLRPKILRDAAQAAFETDLKYNYMLEQEKQIDKMGREALPMLPGVPRGTLPPLPAGGSAPAARPPGGAPPASQAPPPNPRPAAPPIVMPPTGAPAPAGTAAPDSPAATPAEQSPPRQ
jgi:hypothetical protein